MFEGVYDGKVALDRDGDGDEDGAHPADVAEAESHRQDEDVDRASVPGIHQDHGLGSGFRVQCQGVGPS